MVSTEMTGGTARKSTAGKLGGLVGGIGVELVPGTRM